MDVVVRTPHGDADIDIVSTPSTSTLGELIQIVTGQAAPPIARVDGRTVATTQAIGELGLAIGSLIETLPTIDHTVERTESSAVANLLQLAGRGAGSVLALDAGRYRVGTARRLHTSEMERSHVDTTAFSLDVGDRGEVTVHPAMLGSLGPLSSTLDGQILEKPTPWKSGHLSIGGRVFAIETPATSDVRGKLAEPVADGSIPFQRQPAPRQVDRPLAVGAVRAASRAGSELWPIPTSDGSAFEIPFGLHADDVTKCSVNLRDQLGVAIVGSERFSAAVARTLLIEAATLHGPAELNIVIASSTNHISTWNWARWLPHLRRGGPGSAPELLCDSAELASWANAIAQPTAPVGEPTPPTPPSAAGAPNSWSPPTTTPASPRLTILAVDDVALWSRRESPIRAIITNPPPGLRVVALCVGAHEAPGMCSTLIEEIPPREILSNHDADSGPAGPKPALFGSLARLHIRLGRQPQVFTDIRPALMETSIAAEAARLMAPLDDVSARHTLEPPRRLAAPTLGELVSMSEDNNDRDTTRAAIGVDASAPGVGRSPVLLTVRDDRPTIVAAVDPALHDLTIAAIVLGATAQRPRNPLSILIVGREQAPWHSELPDTLSWVSHQDAADPARFIHRIAHVLSERPECNILIVIEDAFGPPTQSQPAKLVTGMLEFAAALPNVGLVLTTRSANDVPDSMSSEAGSFVWISESGDGLLAARGATRQFVAGNPIAGFFAPPSTTSSTSFSTTGFVVRPATQVRSLTTLERRLSQGSGNQSGDDLGFATTAIARDLAKRSAATATPANDSDLSLLPPPMPATVSLNALLDRHSGDGIPLGLIDRPDRSDHDVYWWQPGSNGSLLAIGSPRSGLTTLVDLVAVGVAARISADDLHITAIEPLAQRRRALAALPHAGDVVSPDNGEVVRRLVIALNDEFVERTAEPTVDRPGLLLLVGDVGRVRRALSTDVADEVVALLAKLAEHGSSVGMYVIAIANRIADLGPLNDLKGDRLVGSGSESDDRRLLGAPAIGPADRHPGRCWSTNLERRVQLASVPDSAEHEVALHAPEHARDRPPRRFDPEVSS